jgi:hypothetical protein
VCAFSLTLTLEQGPYILDSRSEIIPDETSNPLLRVRTGTSMEHPVFPNNVGLHLTCSY